MSKDLLCGDIGGTKCLLAICDELGNVVESRRYESAAYSDFAEVVRAFRKDLGGGPLPSRAAFAVAGPVADDVCKTTNLPWVVAARALERALQIGRVNIVNDFTAQALAVLELRDGDLVALCPGERAPHGPIAVLGAGTGLGEAFLVAHEGRYVVVPSEGGHADFAPVDDRQIDFLRTLRAALGGRVSYERVLSGRGLASAYAFLRDRGDAAERPLTRDAMLREDPAAVISTLALRGEDPLCVMALDLFCEVYGQEAGNLALKVLPTGGVFVCGGIAPKILPRLQNGLFQRRYLDKGRMSTITQQIPVFVVTHPTPGLLGAAIAARKRV